MPSEPRPPCTCFVCRAFPPLIIHNHKRELKRRPPRVGGERSVYERERERANRKPPTAMIDRARCRLMRSDARKRQPPYHFSAEITQKSGRTLKTLRRARQLNGCEMQMRIRYDASQGDVVPLPRSLFAIRESRVYRAEDIIRRAAQRGLKMTKEIKDQLHTI